jgi:hypothetical protein
MEVRERARRSENAVWYAYIDSFPLYMCSLSIVHLSHSIYLHSGVYRRQPQCDLSLAQRTDAEYDQTGVSNEKQNRRVVLFFPSDMLSDLHVPW